MIIKIRHIKLDCMKIALILFFAYTAYLSPCIESDNYNLIARMLHKHQAILTNRVVFRDIANQAIANEPVSVKVESYSDTSIENQQGMSNSTKEPDQ